MRPHSLSSLVARIRAQNLTRELFQFAFVLTVVVLLAGETLSYAGDSFRTAPAVGSAGAGDPTATGSGGTAAAPLSSTIDTAALLQQRAVAAISRTDTAIRAMNAAQQAARAAAAAAASSVPNGLQAGGLEPLDLSAMDKWKGALAPTTTAGKPNDVTIVQAEQNALLTWKTFNIGKDTTLTFDQSKGGASAGQWIAFNHVQDASAQPSQILGKLQTIGKADAKGNVPVGGQVYVLNPNGILFGGASQVNVHGLTASTLPINEKLVAQGLLANSDNEFLFSATELDRKGRGVVERVYGDVTVTRGAQLIAPTNQDQNGGRIALFGANVTNDGTISTADGQTILAAGLQIGLDAHDPKDPTVRGLDVFVGGVVPGAGTVVNSGLIEVHRGNVTMTGRSVNQLGVVDSTTSVAYNGSILLDASFAAKSNYNERGDVPAPSTAAKFIPTQTGTVTLGAGSATRVRPEWESTEKVVGSALALVSKINLRGLNIHLGEDSSLWAPGAAVSLGAGRWHADDIDLGTTSVAQFLYEDAPGGPAAPRTGGQIYLDSGALIDVSGTTAVQASVSDNVVKVELRGAEFANSPVQRDGELRGETVYVDIRKTGKREDGTTWIGTPLADVTGYVNLIQRSIGQLTTQGGTVAMNAGGAVVIQDGATVDVSGGYTNYSTGEVRTTRIIEGNRIIDISQATADRRYDGIYSGQRTTTDPKWGTTTTSGGPVSESFLEAGYTEGAAGGSLAITAPVMALDGSLRGQTVAGERQRSQLPPAGRLALNLRSQLLVASSEYSATPFWHALTAPDIVFRSAATLPAVDAFALDADGHARALSPQRVATLELAPSLFSADGFGALAIENTEGDIALPSGTTLAGTAGGQLTLSGANVSILGTVRAPGGRLSFNAYNYSPISELFLGVLPDSPPVVPDRGVFTLGAGASLDTAGRLIDDRTRAGQVQPLATTGGAVTIKGHSVLLEQGGAIDVSGGAVVNAVGKLAYGAAGSLAIEAGQDLTFTNLVEGRLVAKAALRGYSGTVGGKLALKASSIQIGGATERASTLLLRPEYFSEGGFGSFALTGIGEWTATPLAFVPGVMIAPNTILAPKQQNRFAVVGPASLDWAAPTTLLDEALRSPIHLAFTASGLSRQLASGDPRADAFGLLLRGDLVVGERAAVALDAKGSVALTGQTVEIGEGVQVSAPGGSIAVKGAADSSWLFGDAGRSVARPTVLLGAGSLLSAQGAVVKQPKDARGYETGTVLPGGAISVAGNILARPGATLDVRGTSGAVDRLPGYSGQAGLGDSLLSAPELVSTAESSNGGSITLAGSALLVSEATLWGGAGGSSARGGEVVVSSGQFIAPNDIVSFADALDVTLRVRQQALAAGVAERFSGTFDARSTLPVGGGFVTADRLATGGFDRIELRGTVSFEGPVSLAAKGSLTVADGGVLYTDSAVELAAPYVRLGKPFWEPLLPGIVNPHVGTIPGTNDLFFFGPKHGPGTLTVRATDLIDAGDLSLQNTGRLHLLVASGEIRGNGTIDVAGSIFLQAGQIYPTTGGEFTIAAHDYSVDTESVAEGEAPAVQPGTISVAPGVNRVLPLSAGGTLNLYAGHLFQKGTLRAPLGTINLGWDASDIAPKGNLTGSAQPVGRLANLGTGSITSVSAVDPTTGKDLALPYGVILNGISWIDPRGIDITAGGPPEKRVNVSAPTIEHETGATIDLRGGGDLFAYRWVGGNGGRADVLASTTSFAVLPTYAAEFAPHAPYSPLAPDTLGSDRGYVNTTLKVGDRIRLEASAALPAGEYTLLPARYALLPGAVLVTPKSGVPPASALVSPEGASLVSGYRFNSLDAARTGAPLRVAYEVAPQKVVKARAQYDEYSANKFFAENAADRDVVAPRVPLDAGQLVLAATERMQLRGLVSAQGAAKGRNGLVDLSAPGEIRIVGNTAAALPGEPLVLSAADLGTFKAESLLIGGIRRSTAEGTAVTVKAAAVTLDNAGTPLAGSDIVLVANEAIELAAGSALGSTGTLADTAPLLLGDVAVAGSGNGVLVRVSADPEAEAIRRGIAPPEPSKVPGTNEVIPVVTPTLVVGAGVVLDGASGTLDSSHATQLDSTARLGTDSLALSSGRIGLVLDEAGDVEADGSLLLAGGALDTLQQAVGTLSLQGYSSIDLFGHGQVGAVDAAGRPVVAGLELHTAEIRGFNTGEATVVLAARQVRLDNVARGATGPEGTTGQGTLAFKADTLRLGAGELAENGTVAVNGFAAVEVDAATAIIGTEAGGLRVAGDLTLRTPLLTASTAADVAIVATGDLQVGVAGVAGSTTEAGLGARIALTGAQVTTAGTIRLPSGQVAVRATSGDLTVGGAMLVGGTEKVFVDVPKYTDGGSILLESEHGSVGLTAGAVLDVAAHAKGGDAGTLTIAAPEGVFEGSMQTSAAAGAGVDAPATAFAAGVFRGRGAPGGVGGSFSLDVGSIATADFTRLQDALNAGGFDAARNSRIRSGDLTIAGLARSHVFRAAVDRGDLVVTGTIEASGLIGATRELPLTGVFATNPTGGAIMLTASGSVILDAGAWLNAAGALHDNAGKGGSVYLAAGSYSADGDGTAGIDPEATLDLRAGSRIDLGVKHPHTVQEWQFVGGLPPSRSPRTDLVTGTLHLRAPATFAEGANSPSDVAIEPLKGEIHAASSIVAEGFRVYEIGSDDSVVSEGGAITRMGSGGVIDAVVRERARADASAFGQLSAAISDRLLSQLPAGADRNALANALHVQPGVEIVNSGTAGSQTVVVLANADTNASRQSALSFGMLAALESAASAIEFANAAKPAESTYATRTFAVNQLNSWQTVPVPASGNSANDTVAISASATSTKVDVELTWLEAGLSRTTVYTFNNPTTSDPAYLTALGRITGIRVRASKAATVTLKRSVPNLVVVPGESLGGLAAGDLLRVAAPASSVVIVTRRSASGNLATVVQKVAAGATSLDLASDGTEVLVTVASAATSRNTLAMKKNPVLTPGSFDLAVPGGLVEGSGLNLKPVAGWTDAWYRLNYADGTSGAEQKLAAAGGTVFAPADRLVKSITFFNRSTSKKDTAARVTVALVPGAGVGGVSNSAVALVLPRVVAATTSGNLVTATLAGGEKVTFTELGGSATNGSAWYVAGTGDLTLPASWDFGAWRFGPADRLEPGQLALRAAGNLVFGYGASLSDGFTGGTAPRGGLVDQVLLPEGSRSWSYRLVGGADFGAADLRTVLPPDVAKGSILVGVGTPALPTTGTNNNRYAPGGSANMIPARFQTIRTGTGDIDLVAAYDVRLLNNVATIYTAGQQVAALPGFDVPVLGYAGLLTPSKYGFNQFPSAVQYSMAGGNVSIQAGYDIVHLTETKVGGKTVLVDDSSKQLPSNWLYRRGLVDPVTGQFVTRNDTPAGEVMSTTWWIDYSNYYEGVAALGGGNVSLVAGNDIRNIDAAVATNARMPGRDGAGEAGKPDTGALVELGGGDLTIRAGGDLDGGVYYVERGRGTLAVGGAIRTNQTRSTVLPSEARTRAMQESTWLPTTLFLGKGSFDLAAGGDLLVGPVANPFLLPSGSNNGFYNRTYFSTYAPDNALHLSSVGGDIELRNGSISKRGDLTAWYSNVLAYTADQGAPTYAMTLPWLRLAQINGTFGGRVNVFGTAAGLMPARLEATAFGGDIAINGRLNLMPSASGQLELAAAGSLNGFQYVNDDTSTRLREWASSSLNLSDADPDRFPGVATPLGGAGPAPSNREYVGIDTDFMRAFDSLLAETGSGKGSLQDKQALHASEPLHAASAEPVRLYALDGDITGLTLYSPKVTKVIAGHDITDVALYLQNNNPDDRSVVSAGRDIVAFNPNSAARTQAQQAGNRLLANATSASTPAPASGAPTAGDIQIGGPGSLEVLAGRHLDLGVGPNVGDGTGLGLTSIGNARNPALAEDGAALYVLAGLGYKWALRGDQAEFTSAVATLLNPATPGSQAARWLPALGELMGLDRSSNEAVWTAFATLPEDAQRRVAAALMDATHLGAANGLVGSALDFDAFTTAFLNPATAGANAVRYLPALGTKLGLAPTEEQGTWAAYAALPEERRAQLALGVFFTVLRDAGRDYNNPENPLYRDKKYPNGYAAIAALFPGHLWQGDIALTSREIKTFNGGEVGLFAPGGQLTVGLDVSGTQPLDQGILTERGGGISIFTHGSVNVGTSRIFTLRGGPEIIWSSTGDIAAGSSSKTVQSAPPTRVLVDPTSADVKTDLSGLATGGGIGVLATRKDVKPDSVDLIAPAGAIDAGDAGIRSSGNLNIAALTIVNAANIATGGASAGVPATTTPSLGGVVSAASTTTTGTSKTTVAADTSTSTRQVMQTRDLPSLIDVVVTSYGGDDKSDEDESESGSNAAQRAPAAEEAAVSASLQG